MPLPLSQSFHIFTVPHTVLGTRDNIADDVHTTESKVRTLSSPSWPLLLPDTIGHNPLSLGFQLLGSPSQFGLLFCPLISIISFSFLTMLTFQLISSTLMTENHLYSNISHIFIFSLLLSLELKIRVSIDYPVPHLGVYVASKLNISRTELLVSVSPSTFFFFIITISFFHWFISKISFSSYPTSNLAAKFVDSFCKPESDLCCHCPGLCHVLSGLPITPHLVYPPHKSQRGLQDTNCSSAPILLRYLPHSQKLSKLSCKMKVLSSELISSSSTSHLPCSSLTRHTLTLRRMHHCPCGKDNLPPDVHRGHSHSSSSPSGNITFWVRCLLTTFFFLNGDFYLHLH